MPEDTRPVAAAPHSDANWAMAVDLDLQTVLILAKASTQALLNLSPLAYREITSAIAEEVKVLREQGDARSLATARAVEQYLPRAA
ncbi:hypothetical protein [Phenylobacterium aquaticum]|uniref:hypothetical protein n=1 Tax=Phenylobacterium aquaticum TaxID=1763816 RepID=UPI0026EC2C8F|nr:hypothetical protein [Phenylobacterium aquaticum]